jgi:hypothetical protein
MSEPLNLRPSREERSINQPKTITGACQFSKPCPEKTQGTKTCYYSGKCFYKKLLTSDHGEVESDSA